MLKEILDYIHNYFAKEVYKGKFKIVNGLLDVNFLQDDQYFKIEGSIFNDGVHKYSADDVLHDEEFSGLVTSMAVPQDIINLSDEITAWMNEYGKVVNSPYQSESFGGYSYTKANGSGSNSQVSWQDKFSSRLNAYRKIS